MAAVSSKVAGRTFTNEDEYQKWTEDVIKWMREMVLELDGSQQILRGLLENTPTSADGNTITNIGRSRRSAKAVAAKLANAGDDLMAAAGKTRAAFAIFERDYLGAVVATTSSQKNGMRLNRITGNASSRRTAA